MKARHLIAGAAVVLSGCINVNIGAPGPQPARCDWLNHSGVCEVYAPVTDPYPELRKRDPGGDIDLSAHIKREG